MAAENDPVLSTVTIPDPAPPANTDAKDLTGATFKDRATDLNESPLSVPLSSPITGAVKIERNFYRANLEDAAIPE